jgi:peptidoglycan L-alanyl-D-glutamate endopeptidase CwlK
MLELALHFVDFTVIECHRGQEAQSAAFDEGNSQVQWPNSKHNLTLSEAVDVVPYPLDWNDMERFYYVLGTIMGVGQLYLWLNGLDEKYMFRYGGDWDRDSQVQDETFRDLGHIELVRLEK